MPSFTNHISTFIPTINNLARIHIENQAYERYGKEHYKQIKYIINSVFKGERGITYDLNKVEHLKELAEDL